MNCKFATSVSINVNHCSIGLYGSYPSVGVCSNCIKRGENNESYAKELFSRYEKSHPPLVKKISGCCDSAKNYT